MTERDNERVVQKIIEAINRHDSDAMMNHFADGSIQDIHDGTRLDKEGIRKDWAGDFAGFPDIKWRGERMVSQGNTVVVEGTATGTHKGEWRGIPATNKKVEVLGTFIFDLAAGKVKLWKTYMKIRGVSQMERLLHA